MVTGSVSPTPWTLIDQEAAFPKSESPPKSNEIQKVCSQSLPQPEVASKDESLTSLKEKKLSIGDLAYEMACATRRYDPFEYLILYNKIENKQLLK